MEIIDKFKNQSTILKILDVAFIISFIYEIITSNGYNMTLIILGLIAIATFCEWFFKKEE